MQKEGKLMEDEPHHESKHHENNFKTQENLYKYRQIQTSVLT